MNDTLPSAVRPRTSLPSRSGLALALAMSGAVACAKIDNDHAVGGLERTPAAAGAAQAGAGPAASHFLNFRAPAGDRPATRSILIDGYNAAILPNGRLVTPIGQEINVDAPKPFGLAIAPSGRTAITVNSGSSRFSVTLIRNISGPGEEQRAEVKRVPLNSTFMGVALSPDCGRWYASGGEIGNIWVGDMMTGQVIGSVNLNGAEHPLPSPSLASPKPDPSPPLSTFKGSYPGNLTVSADGRTLYVVDQGNFSVQVIDTTKIATGVDELGQIKEMNNFAALVNTVRVGRYPFGITLAPGDHKLYVANVGVFQYTHLIPRGPARQPGGTLPPNPSGVANDDYPLCIPGAGYPEETENDRTIMIKKIDATTITGLPLALRDPEGIRCGYVTADRAYTIPGLGSPNVDDSSSVFVLDVTAPTAPRVIKKIKSGPLVGQVEDGITTYGASHPNSVAVGARAAYVANGNNDSISIVDINSSQVVATVPLSPLGPADARLKGIQPVSVALSPDEKRLYVAEAGINAVAVLELGGPDGGDIKSAKVIGHIPTGWWPANVKLSADGLRLFVANARGRGGPPNTTGEAPDPNGHPKHSVFGSVQVIDLPDRHVLRGLTARVLANNGFVEGDAPAADPGNPIPTQPGVASQKIKHVVFIAKENLTHDLIIGDILRTRRGVPVNGDPRFALGYDGSPNHHELALQFAFSDNFFLEPVVSSDGHRWLVNNPTTEFEEAHWPASYGGRRRDAGDNAEVIEKWFGRLGFTDANASVEPHDYPQHGNLFVHLARHRKTFVNFGEGYEFAIVDEDPKTEPTGIREHVNVPMQKVLRDNTDHLYPQFNTAIPDAPLPENPDRFNRFGRFAQVFSHEFVKDGACNLPDFTYLLYPNDHGGGANDINGPAGPKWDFKRFVQDNDAALGLTVDLISKSPCWQDTVIFVTEDDTQSGLDHVDGHRTVFLAISPWVKHQHVSKTHTSLASMFKTINLILGLPPLNTYDAAATDLRELFTAVPDPASYDFVPPATQTVLHAAAWDRLTRTVDFNSPDLEEVDLRAAIMRSEGLPRKRALSFRPRQPAHTIQ
jgi:YVTN family beta-propeller protein